MNWPCPLAMVLHLYVSNGILYSFFYYSILSFPLGYDVRCQREKLLQFKIENNKAQIIGIGGPFFPLINDKCMT